MAGEKHTDQAQSVRTLQEALVLVLFEAGSTGTGVHGLIGVVCAHLRTGTHHLARVDL